MNATIERYGGRFLVRGTGETLEGDWRPRLVVIEFPNLAQARSWYDSPEYRPLRELRQRSADTQLRIVDSV